MRHCTENRASKFSVICRAHLFTSSLHGFPKTEATWSLVQTSHVTVDCSHKSHG